MNVERCWRRVVCKFECWNFVKQHGHHAVHAYRYLWTPQKYG